MLWSPAEQLLVGVYDAFLQYSQTLKIGKTSLHSNLGESMHYSKSSCH